MSDNTFRVYYITCARDTTGYTSNAKQVTGRYVRALAVYQGLMRHVARKVDPDKSLQGKKIEFHVLGWAQGDISAIGHLSQQCVQEPIQVSCPIVQEVDMGEGTPYTRFGEIFQQLDNAGQAPDLVLLDGTSTLEALRGLLWERSGKCLTPKTIKYHLTKFDHRQLSPLRNAKIWLLARYEPDGFPNGQRWVHCVDRFYYLENFTQQHLDTVGQFLAKQVRRQSSLTHRNELADRKLLAPLVREPEDMDEDVRLMPHEKRRKHRRRLFDTLKLPLPNGVDPEAARPLIIMAASAARPQDLLADPEIQYAAQVLQSYQGPVEFTHTSPATLPGGLARYVHGMDGLIATAGYNTVRELALLKLKYRLARNLQLGRNLMFVPTSPTNAEQFWRAWNVDQIMGDVDGKLQPVGNSGEYLAEQILIMAGGQNGQ